MIKLDFDLWKIGFILVSIGIGIPIAYGSYVLFTKVNLEWYWNVSIICIILGCGFLVFSAARDRMESSKPEEKV